MATDYTQREAEAEIEMMRHDARYRKLFEIQEAIGDQPISLAIGDIATYLGPDRDKTHLLPEEIPLFEEIGEEVIVTAISATGDEYGIEGLNWVPRTALKFERHADVESLTKALIIIENEEDDDSDEDGN